MPERRSKTLVANLEPSFYDIAQRYIAKLEMSQSAYLRNLVILDLEAAGLITPDLLARVIRGEQP